MQKAITIKIPVEKIVSKTDRKYGGQGDIELLSKSIEEHGLINPIAVKEIPEEPETYRIIAGRRRLSAILLLGRGTIDATVYDPGADEEAIALAENVNRMEMHPLDEAEIFKKELESGKTAKEIAVYYDRPVSGILHRIRLCDLHGDIKQLFREEKIYLSGAALLASLPIEDQQKFCKKFEGKTFINNWDITGFMHQVQHYTLAYIEDDGCKKCKKRTFNTEPGLFEDIRLDDVCFDSMCYREKWQLLIDKLFLFLTALTLGTGCLPDIDDSDKQWAETENSLFWKFAQITKEEYIDLYKQILAETVNAVESQDSGEADTEAV